MDYEYPKTALEFLAKHSRGEYLNKLRNAGDNAIMVFLSPAKAKKRLIGVSALCERWRPRYARSEQIKEGHLNSAAAIRVTGIVKLIR